MKGVLKLREAKTGTIIRASLTLKMLNHVLLTTEMVSFLYPIYVVVLLFGPTYKWTFCNRRPKSSEQMRASKELAPFGQPLLSFLCENFSSLIHLFQKTLHISPDWVLNAYCKVTAFMDVLYLTKILQASKYSLGRSEKESVTMFCKPVKHGDT